MPLIKSASIYIILTVKTDASSLSNNFMYMVIINTANNLNCTLFSTSVRVWLYDSLYDAIDSCEMPLKS